MNSSRPVTPSRREILRSCATGLPLIGLYSLLAAEANADTPSDSALSPKSPPLPARAKSVIFLFMGGGPSQLDLFDPEPLVARYKQIPIALPKVTRDATKNCLPSPYEFSRHGDSDIEITELFPHLSAHADDLCVIRSMVCDHVEHSGARRQGLTGDGGFPRPSIGSWVLYGLGSESENLPGFVFLGEHLSLIHI